MKLRSALVQWRVICRNLVSDSRRRQRLGEHRKVNGGEVKGEEVNGEEVNGEEDKVQAGTNRGETWWRRRLCCEVLQECHLVQVLPLLQYTT